MVGGGEPLQERRLVKQGKEGELVLLWCPHGDFSFFLEPHEVTIVSSFY